MKPNEAMHVLAVCASYDNRVPSQATATAWAYDLADIGRDEAVAAVREHYRNRPDTWIKPGHVVDLVKARRRLGLQNVSRVEAAAIAEIDPDDPRYTEKVQRALADARQAAASGQVEIPAHVLPAREETAEERRERARRGAALARAELEKHRTESEPEIEEGVSETLQRAREAARQYKADRDRPAQNPPRPLAGAVNELRGRLSAAALSTRTTERPTS